jgi:hypothetical protein
MLSGKSIRLEPVVWCHVAELIAASGTALSPYQCSPVPQGEAEAARYVETALAWRDAGTAVRLRRCESRATW